MAEGNDSQNSSLPIDWMARTATEMTHAGFKYLFGNATSPDQSSASDTWLTKLLDQYRAGLGPLLAIIPSVIERTARSTDPGSGRRVLYRSSADDDPLFSFVAAVGLELHESCQSNGNADSTRRVAMSDSLMEDLRKLGDRSGVADILGPDIRLDLPVILDELRHDARLDRPHAARRAYDRLKFLLEGNRKCHFEKVDELEDILGEHCFSEIVRQGFVGEFSGEVDGVGFSKPKDISTAFQTLMTQIGHGNSPCCAEPRLTILSRHSPPHAPDKSSSAGTRYLEYWLFDHARDAVYEIRGRERLIAGKKKIDQLELFGSSEGRTYEVTATSPCGGATIDRYRLPFRVADASQAFASWTIDRRLIQDYIENCFPKDPLIRALDLGSERTLLILSFVDYRETDFRYPTQELVLAALVAPEDDPFAVGLLPLGDILVSTEENAALGIQAWGFPKRRNAAASEHSHTSSLRSSVWTVHYRPSRLSLMVSFPAKHEDASDTSSPNQRQREKQPRDLSDYRQTQVEQELPPGAQPHDLAEISVTFPRRAQSNSPALPIAWYTHRHGQWHKSILTRIGIGESLRPGRSGFDLSVSPGLARWDAKSIPGWLYAAGIVDGQGRCIRAPMSTGWTEQFSASIGPASLLPRAGQGTKP